MKKLFLLSWLLVPIVALWITTNYIIGLGRNPTWNASSNQELVHKVESSPIADKQLVWNGGGLVTLWFDDAWSTQFDPAYNLMESRGFTGALAVPTEAVGTDGYMGWAQIKMLQYKGWEISSHSQKHDCTLSHLTTSYEDSQLKGAKNDLSSHGIYVNNYVPPCGAITPATTVAAKKYYSSLRTSDVGLNTLPVSNPYDLHVHTVLRETTIDEINTWLAEAKQQNAWLIIVMHQVDDDTTQYGMNAGMLQNTLDAVKASQLPVVLPDQVLQMKVTP